MQEPLFFAETTATAILSSILATTLVFCGVSEFSGYPTYAQLDQSAMPTARCIR